ncbi:hypothetical protein [Rhizobium lentis]|uniref:Uncharacterized protein n=1 Tax=Rhizobium lentis TaxID=1138194 RepID=A0ABS7I9H1_9HYPH|nr:hypothetical protein [Rhizobium lentis]MBX5041143.1 hypothetical protein [Rhizobium lentis]MBX5051872.1 hypothetical protein [Rhizobium lentis]MBX5071430.1 hypothetical protein [Rhizobium lentis]MBX5088492.1 hypothetical protein [Rhizobium lentis]MBX5108532.1 hypothetical protein [Rhizobium lentis]
MSYRVAHLDSRKRALEKQESRERDQVRLDNGSVSPAQLRRENSAFAELPLHRYKMVAIGGKALARS